MDRPTGSAIPPAEDYPYVNDNGLGYIAASSKEAGADVTLFGWNINLDVETFRKKLLNINPDIVGVKVFTTHFSRVYRTLTIIRETLPDTTIVIGGPHPSTNKPKNLFNEFEGIIDYAIAGDGESGISKLIKKMTAKGGRPEPEELNDVPGLIYKNGDEIRANSPSWDMDLDRLPHLDWSIQQPSWFKSNILFLDDSRGCPATCAHCNSYLINGPRVRHRSLKALCSEIENLIDLYNVNTIAFTGNVFLSNTDYVKELCEWMLQSKISLKWLCTGSAYADKLRNKKLTALMRRAGCFQIQFGIESGSPEIRKKLSYPLPLDSYPEIISRTVEAGIHAHGSFMFGFPGETKAQMNETIRFAATLPLTTRVYCICLPLPGTFSYEAVLKKYGIEYIDWMAYNFSNPQMLPCEPSLKELKRKLLLAKTLERSGLANKIYKRLFIK